MQLWHKHFSTVDITKNPGIKKIFIHFFIDDSNANISLYDLICPNFDLGQLKVWKLSFGYTSGNCFWL